jgi:hypothetical protein
MKRKTNVVDLLALRGTKRRILKFYANANPSGALLKVRIRKSISKESQREIGRNWMYEGNRTDFVHSVAR